MFFKSIRIRNFSLKKRSSTLKKKVSKLLYKLINSNNHILSSLKRNYKDSYDKKLIINLKKYKVINLVGMGGSSLGSKAIYNFLNTKKKLIL